MTITVKDSASGRKQLGAFYTPQRIACVLTEWALRAKEETVFDSSFGGCAFLAAALKRLRLLGNQYPWKNVYGVDVDPNALSYLMRLPGYRETTGNFRIADFLRIRPESFRGRRFDVILGNPPYVRHQLIADHAIARAQLSIGRLGYVLPRTAGYWAYFVLHSTAFLQDGGRMALILPGAVLSAGYAESIRRLIARKFAEVKLLVMRDRLFREATAASVILLADGWHKSGRKVSLFVGLRDSTLARACEGQVRARPLGERVPRVFRRSLISTRVERVLRTAEWHRSVRRLGDLVRVKIGVVTGANSFFVLSAPDAERHGLAQRALVPIVTAAADVRSLRVTKGDMKRMRSDGRRCLLFLAEKQGDAPGVRRYLRSAAANLARMASQCRRRKLWSRVPDIDVSPALLTYTVGHVPRLVLNPDGALCTNALHRVWWKSPKKKWQEKLIAVSFLTSLTGLTAELYGRGCDRGALKLEPSEAKRLLLAWPTVDVSIIDRVFIRCSRMMAKGAWREARRLADEFVLRAGVGLGEGDVAMLRSAQDRLRRIREGVRVDASAATELGPLDTRAAASIRATGRRSGAICSSGRT